MGIQPRKQRKARSSAFQHVRRKMLSAHLAKELRKEIKRRAVPIRKGDEVKVMRGKFRNIKGTIELVDLKKCKVFVKGVSAKKNRWFRGFEANRPLKSIDNKIIRGQEEVPCI